MNVQTGTVTSNKMQRTLVVTVDSYKRHPKYMKRFKVSKKFYADCENSADYRIGDVVTIAETRPLSKLKRWKVTGKVASTKILTRLPQEETPLS